jgi:hypothetical protein
VFLFPFGVPMTIVSLELARFRDGVDEVCVVVSVCVRMCDSRARTRTHT